MFLVMTRRDLDLSFTPSRGPSRAQCQRQAREVVAMLSSGSYVSHSGRVVNVGHLVHDAVKSTIEYAPDDAIPSPRRGRGSSKTTFSVVNGTSLQSAREIAARSERPPFVLNFASAKNPGGGFLNGARAQEESLARSSALYACIEGRQMYCHHRGLSDCMYTSWMIWSPAVPVVRDDHGGTLLDEPYVASFLTAPAPNAGVVLSRDPSRREEVTEVLASRVTRALSIAAAHEATHLVLGAWGCGVFGNDPGTVADAFRRELDGGSFEGVFDEVVFAVLDWSEDRHFIRPFAERFG